MIGIDVRYIMGRKTPVEFFHHLRKQGSDGWRIFHLDCLFSRRPFSSVNPESVILLIKSDNGSYFLIVDRIVAEKQAPSWTDQLPPLYPPLAKQICPYLMSHKNEVIMILDPEQVIPLYEKLGTGQGLISRDDVLAKVDPEKDDEEHESEKQIKGKTKKPSLSIGEETFSQIVTWTIAQIKKQPPDNMKKIKANDLPSEVTSQKGLSTTVIQYMIDQIVTRYKEVIIDEK